MMPYILAALFFVLAIVTDEPGFFILLSIIALGYGLIGRAYRNLVAEAKRVAEQAKRDGVKDGETIKIKIFGKERNATFRRTSKDEGNVKNG